MTCPHHSACDCCGRCSWCGERIESTVAPYHTLPLPTEPYWPYDEWTPWTGPLRVYPGTTTGGAT